MTAAQFLCEISNFDIEHTKIGGSIDKKVADKMITFAKFHTVKAITELIKSLPENSDCTKSQIELKVDQALKFVYPLSNIN